MADDESCQASPGLGSRLCCDKSQVRLRDGGGEGHSPLPLAQKGVKKMLAISYTKWEEIVYPGYCKSWKEKIVYDGQEQTVIVRATYAVISFSNSQFVVTDVKVLRETYSFVFDVAFFIDATPYVQSHVYQDILVKAHEYGEKLCEELHFLFSFGRLTGPSRG